jgi:catechol 2,3-dioxygenase-like lactoylglutathione lyase family enzyme
MHLHHLAIQVTDLAIAHDFYCGTLELPEIRRQDHSIWVDAGGIIVMLELCDGQPPTAADQDWPSDAPGPHVIAFGIAAAQRDRWRQRLEQTGVTLSHTSAFTMYFRDPFGTRLGLSHFPEPQR